MGFGTKDSDEAKTAVKEEQEIAEKTRDATGKDKVGDKKDSEGRDWKRNGKPFCLFFVKTYRLRTAR